MKRTAILTFSALVNAARTGSLSPRPYRAPRPAVRGPPILPVGGLFHFADIDSWHFSDVTAGLRNVCCWGKSGSRDCVTRLPSLTRNRSRGTYNFFELTTCAEISNARPP